VDKAIICTPDEMSRLQYIEESKMLFEERLKLAFDMLQLSDALSANKKEYNEPSDIEWITLKMVHD
jgi:hypothetical protein